MADPTNTDYVPAGTSPDTPPQEGGETKQEQQSTPSSDKPWYEGRGFAEKDIQLVKKYKSEDAFHEGSFNAMRMVGDPDSRLEIPKEDDAKYDEKMRAIHTKLGCPEDPKGYDFEVPQLPPDLEGRLVYDEALDAEVKGEAHKLGVSKTALNRLAEVVLTGQLKREQAILDAQKSEAKKLSESMKAEMGEDKYATLFGSDERDAEGNRTNSGLVGRLIRSREDSDRLISELEGDGKNSLGNNPALNRLMGEAAEALIGEGTTDRGGASEKGKEATEQLSEYERNKKAWPESPKMWGNPDK